MVCAVDQASAHLVQPALTREAVALRASAVMTGVVPRALDVPIRTALHVTAQLGGTAGTERIHGASLCEAQSMVLSIPIKVLVEHIL